MIEILAPAKINLGLGVVARRGDGFHDIDTLLVTLDLCDRLLLEPLDGNAVEGAALPATDPFVAAQAPAVDADNLAVQAARTYLAAAGWPGGVRVHLGKAIPVAAGLGGGSSDAGAVLRGLTGLYPSGLDLAALAAELGSDVPFFADGHGAARARGRGDRLEPVAVPTGHAVLVNPGVAVAAAEAYGWLTATRSTFDFSAILDALGDGRAPALHNDLQAGVAARQAPVRAALAALTSVGLGSVRMSGSGATCFGLATDAAAAEAVAAALAAAHPGWWVRPTRFPCGVTSPA